MKLNNVRTLIYGYIYHAILKVFLRANHKKCIHTVRYNWSPWKTSGTIEKCSRLWVIQPLFPLSNRTFYSFIFVFVCWWLCHNFICYECKVSFYAYMYNFLCTLWFLLSVCMFYDGNKTNNKQYCIKDRFF